MAEDIEYKVGDWSSRNQAAFGALVGCEMRMVGRRDTVLLTVAFNIVDYEDTSYYLTRQRWAANAGLKHVYVTERTTGLRLDAHCAAWLRIPIMLLIQEYDVFYLDSDCIIDAACPKPSAITGGLSGLFIARGHSTRPNSGVMVASGDCSDLLAFCVEHYADEPPEACQAPFENGHVIWACQHYPWRPLHPSFNVTTGTVGNIIHHTGPNRALRTLDYQSNVEASFDYSADQVTDTGSLLEMGRRVLSGSCFDGVS